jgi:hypothetical protein
VEAVLPETAVFHKEGDTALIDVGDPLPTWDGTEPATGALVLSVLVTTSDGTYTAAAPAGWTELATDSHTAEGITTRVIVAGVDSWAGTEDQFWDLGETVGSNQFEGAWTASWVLEGGSGLTWQTPDITSAALSYTESAGDYLLSDTVDWVAPDAGWAVFAQAILVGGWVSGSFSGVSAPAESGWGAGTATGLAASPASDDMGDMTTGTGTPESGSVTVSGTRGTFLGTPAPKAWSIAVGAA